MSMLAQLTTSVAVVGRMSGSSARCARSILTWSAVSVERSGTAVETSPGLATSTLSMA
ncbi:hypothetical protein PF005_g26601 [Phytophthora fragariae]|uniref:Uncharacterized protein n=1 Tax=Phytophthora fragariae TaxID=53985 RepID=A0A6A3W910_9STRA|nr:hypothetical protein PF011_g25316 [Phytophthora fragariae]KAE9172671.1 hypothetical protein PF005_g26601 [Phytophthora fragariae]KAE9178043.1 hypothetical protein PF004_g25602 [Phytophthora fragariae]KAE9181260.1 hypothetical protein PF002_g27322 [Phytophthora fragariae]